MTTYVPDLLDVVGGIVRRAEVPDEVGERTRFAAAAGRLRVDLADFEHRLGVNGTPVAPPAKPPTVPPDPPPPSKPGGS